MRKTLYSGSLPKFSRKLIHWWHHDIRAYHGIGYPAKLNRLTFTDSAGVALNRVLEAMFAAPPMHLIQMCHIQMNT
ncbi:uncharacterized protein BDV14DRAFT_22197 [Aspergillus stella-maris]|uniref:uncharacterized protein n=1 Tax=Aspergillus stella-maris TaxID=1810926 RepID=UPI003CCE3EC7